MRAARRAAFADSAEVERVLETLAARAEGAVVQRLPRQPGRREARYAQLLTGELSADLTTEPAAAVEPAARAEVAGDARVDLLEAELRTLRAELAELRRELGELRSQWQALL